MNLRHPFDDENGDSLHEECGVFGAINAGSEASTTTALGLHALQHRGQEAAGITSFDGTQFYTRRGLGHVAENFSSAESIAELPGFMAVGHVRYSTTGGAGLRNVQPLYADLASGGFALATRIRQPGLYRGLERQMGREVRWSLLSAFIYGVPAGVVAWAGRASTAMRAPFRSGICRFRCCFISPRMTHGSTGRIAGCTGRACSASPTPSIMPAGRRRPGRR